MANTGKYQVLPGAFVTTHVEVHTLRTPSEEDDWFGKSGFGGGAAALDMETYNYWDRSDAPHYAKVHGDVPFNSGDDFLKTKEALKNGTGNVVIYIATRAIFRDKFGWIISESCSWFQGPEFSPGHLCNGHNGPGKYPSGKPG